MPAFPAAGRFAMISPLMPSIRQPRAPLVPAIARLERGPQPVVVHRRDLAAGETIAWHRHLRAQLVHASEGVMTVTTAGGAYVVPPARGVWMPAGVEHHIDARTEVAMRTLYVAAAHTADLPPAVCVVQVTPLLHELILAAVAAGNDYADDSPQARLVGVILDQIRALPVAPLALPTPQDARLRRVADALRADPGSALALGAWAKLAGASERTLARLFEAETGMSFRAWRQQLRLLRALELLAAGAPVTRVALDLGYESSSAFSAMFRRVLGTTPTRYFGNTGRNTGTQNLFPAGD
jgi:AraC-like DNA-binding protein